MKRLYFIVPVMFALAAWSSSTTVVAEDSNAPKVAPDRQVEAPPADGGKMCGVGMVIGHNELTKKFSVRKIADGSPASKTDIKEGDELVAIDGSPIEKQTIDDCANKIRGQSGTLVTLTFMREGQRHDVKVVRGEFTVPPPPTPAAVPESEAAPIAPPEPVP